MRWRFIDPKNLAEVAERNRVVAKVESWWAEFQGKTADISALFSQKSKWDLAAWMDTHLQSIHPHLMWEFGPAVRGAGHRLVITPESAHQLRPLVRAILERAPRIDGWEFYEYRLAEDLESTQMTVEGRTGRDITDFMVQPKCTEQRCIDLAYTSPSITAPDDPSALNAAFVATETLLGEKCLNDWIGTIGITPIPKPKGLSSLFKRDATRLPHFVGLDRIQATVDALIGSMREQMPPDPHFEWVEEAKWTIWELKPEPADDFEGQSDLFVGKSANPSMWSTAHHDGLFCSERFSRCAESFCYVKIDGSEGLSESGFADKSEIEDALDLVLKPQKLGCHIGGGTGLRYSYIDLALTDLDQGIQAARQRLQAGNVPKRSWIQFYDSHLAAEWVGVYDHSPPPPMDPDS